MAQKPLTKTQAKVAFLAQANHFTRLGTPSKIDTELLLNSLSALLAIHGQKVGFKFEGDAAGDFEPTPELTVALEKYMPQMRNLVDVSAQPVTISESAPVELVTIEPELVTIDWSEAPKGTTHYYDEGGLWYKKTLNGWFFSADRSDDWDISHSIGTDNDDLKESDLIPRPVTTPARPEPIEALSLSVRAQQLLVSAEILTIPDLVNKTEAELLEIKGLGKKSLAEIVEALKRHIGGQAA